MFEMLNVFVALFGSFFAGIWDLKTTDIPDSVCLSMIGIGFATHILESLMIGSWEPLITSLIVGFGFLLFGLFMYFSGQWGGGDGELMVAIGVLIPTYPFQQFLIPFAFAFFVNVFFIGAIYSILYAVFLTMRDKKLKRSVISNLNKNKNFILYSFVFSTIIGAGVYYIFGNILFAVSFPVLITLFAVLFFFLKDVEKGFHRKILSKNLKVDDMIGEDIPKLKIFKKEIRGLTKKEVSAIKRMKKYVVIRDGVRFGIVFPLALLATIILGDFLTYLIF